jgi:hypothetical protein
MRDNPATTKQADAAPRRAAARRTALWLGAIAVAVYVGFILMGVLGR